ncbi:benzoate/H(+) symporter BenE family transporter [Undibacterium sp. RuRC25W]|uniref:benzoate/H(+) symporter BenE family transporter n=1 Tax=Undibacterium sp. RuRC25W TaxID=3413047 RepID=UPI003BF0A3CA
MKTPPSPAVDANVRSTHFSYLIKDYFPAVVAGMIAVLISYAGPMLLMLQAAQAAHLSDALSSSWLWAVSVGSGLCGVGLSYRYKIPVICAWNTPGAALLVTGLMTVPYQEAIGAYVVAAALAFIIGITGAFQKIMSAIPKSLCAAMLAGILFRFGVDIFANARSEVSGAPILTATLFLAYLLFKRRSTRYAIVLTLLTGILLSILFGWGNPPIIHLGNETRLWSLALTTPVWTTPQFSFNAIISLGLPLALLCLTGQQVPGIAVLRAAGFEKAPVSQLISITSITSLLLAPFGSHGINLAAITAAICTGPEAHHQIQKRWIAGIACGIFYILIGCFAGSLKSLFLLLPHALVTTIAGLALLGAIQNGLSNAMENPTEREPALITFIVTASNITVMGLGAACWGIILGILSYLLLRQPRKQAS